MTNGDGRERGGPVLPSVDPEGDLLNGECRRGSEEGPLRDLLRKHDNGREKMMDEGRR
jgi:hypothetical protein